MTTANRLYRILFQQNDKMYEIYTKYLSDESLMGFIEAESLVFSDTSSDEPVTELEALKTEFSGVSRVHIPIHLVIRIDEVEAGGLAKVTSGVQKADVKPFPTTHRPISRDDK